MDARNLKVIGKALMGLSTGTMLVGAYVGFIAPDTFAIPTQVAAHISILLGAVTLKFSYIMHLNACKHLGVNEFSPVNSSVPPPLITPSENFVHECCLTGMHRL
jgi:hypothetical protein